MNNKIEAKIHFKSLVRVFKYITKNYKIRLFFVILCILLTTASSVSANLYLQTLIDDYIIPLVGATNPVYTPLLKAIITMVIIYGVGVISSFLSSRLMVKVSEGTLKNIRDEILIHTLMEI